MAKDNRLYLKQALDSVNSVLKYTKGVDFALFESDELVQNASIRQMEILGESVKRISEKFLQRHPEIEWLEMIGMRNVLSHEYDEIDLMIVWKTIVEDLPGLKIGLEKILGDEVDFS